MQWQESTNGFVLRLERGEEVLTSLENFCKEQSVMSAFVCGIGALENVEICAYDIKKKTYICRKFAESQELLSLLGNVTQSEGKPFCHIHVVLGNEEYHVNGGHLQSGRVSVTCEIEVRTSSRPIERIADEETGLHLWRLKNHRSS
jgi:hypothetical protein